MAFVGGVLLAVALAVAFDAFFEWRKRLKRSARPSGEVSPWLSERQEAA